MGSTLEMDGFGRGNLEGLRFDVRTSRVGGKRPIIKSPEVMIMRLFR